MRRLVAAALLALALAAPAAASESHPTLVELESRVMCPICKTTLDQSNSAAAQRIEAVIVHKIAAGETRSQIEQGYFVTDFGPAILASPPHKGFDLLAWWLPIVAVVGGSIVLAAAAWHWSRTRERDGAAPAASAAGALDPDLERRLDEELARFDA